MSTLEVKAIQAPTGYDLDMPAGHIVQVVNYQTTAVSTGTTIIPDDDTIPQNTEGTEFMTVSITPKKATNNLLIIAEVVFATSIVNPFGLLLFRDSTADCLASNKTYSDKANEMRTAYVNHFVSAGSTNATTFKIRCGMPNAGTVTFNGVGGRRQDGGTLSSSIKVMEISA